MAGKRCGHRRTSPRPKRFACEPLIDRATLWLVNKARWFSPGSRVYFFECNSEFVKIGWTNDVHKRLIALRTATPYPLEICAIFDAPRLLEQAFHREFADQHRIGEWFQYRGALARFLSMRAIVDARRQNHEVVVARG